MRSEGATYDLVALFRRSELVLRGEPVDGVVLQADEAMYRAKTSGRDCPVCDAGR